MSKQALECRRMDVREIPACAKVVFDAFNSMAAKDGSPAIPEIKIVSDRLTEYANDTGIPGLLYGGFADGPAPALGGQKQLRGGHQLVKGSRKSCPPHCAPPT